MLVLKDMTKKDYCIKANLKKIKYSYLYPYELFYGNSVSL